ncbi:hypothetical protein WN59_12670 [Salinicoccus sediminis]|uniref:Uncharacterized protein n=1 Tax=Salinicoccus sediminis TaxID=1432562 RepID=A0A0M2SF50_9STAP|nr:hypothetical protein WN59_12670 [Salinicoccus sediminis]
MLISSLTQYSEGFIMINNLVIKYELTFIQRGGGNWPGETSAAGQNDTVPNPSDRPVWKIRRADALSYPESAFFKIMDKVMEGY